MNETNYMLKRILTLSLKIKNTAKWKLIQIKTFDVKDVRIPCISLEAVRLYNIKISNNNQKSLFHILKCINSTAVGMDNIKI